MMERLKSMSYAELAETQQQIAAEMGLRREQERMLLVEELNALARARGFNLADALPAMTRMVDHESENTRRVRKPVAAKYRHPTQRELTWAGRGKSPRWVTEWLATGNTLDELRV